MVFWCGMIAVGGPERARAHARPKKSRRRGSRGRGGGGGAVARSPPPPVLPSGGQERRKKSGSRRNRTKSVFRARLNEYALLVSKRNTWEECGRISRPPATVPSLRRKFRWLVIALAGSASLTPRMARTQVFVLLSRRGGIRRRWAAETRASFSVVGGPSGATAVESVAGEPAIRSVAPPPPALRGNAALPNAAFVSWGRWLPRRDRRFSWECSSCGIYGESTWRAGARRALFVCPRCGHREA